MSAPLTDLPHRAVALSAKVVVSGAFGVGKTTFISSVSDIPPGFTEEVLTAAGAEIDSLDGIRSKKTTTVASDIGRITIPDEDSGAGTYLYLYGTPGQERFSFMWEELTNGALGAIILVDTRRFQDCFPAVDYFIERRIPFLIAVNTFPDSLEYETEEIRRALGLGHATPIMNCDARKQAACSNALDELFTHCLSSLLAAEVRTAT